MCIYEYMICICLRPPSSKGRTASGCDSPSLCSM